MNIPAQIAKIDSLIISCKEHEYELRMNGNSLEHRIIIGVLKSLIKAEQAAVRAYKEDINNNIGE